MRTSFKTLALKNAATWIHQVVSMIYTLGKDFFAAATFKGLVGVSFQSKKVCCKFGL